MQSSYRPESNSVVRRSTRNKAEARLARNRLESTRKENQDGFSSYSGPPTVRDPETHLDVTPKPFDDEDDVKKPNNSRKSHGADRALTEEASQMGILSSYANASPDASENLEDSNSQASIEPSATESTSGLDSAMSKRAKSSTDELSIDRMSSQHATDGSSAIHPTTSISEMNKSSNRRRDSIAIRRTSYNRLKEMTAEERFYWGLQEVSVALKETPTFMIFERPDEAAMKHTKSYEINELNNARYIKLKESIPGSDRYANKGIITLNPPLKTTETSAFVPELKTPGSGQQTESWRVDDETRILYDDENDDEMPHHNLNIPSADPEGSVNINSDRLTVDEEPIDEAQDDQGTDLDGREEEEGMSKTDNAEVGLRKKDQAWIHNPSVIQTLTILERIVVGNIFESRQLQYRGTSLEVGLDPFCTASVTLEGNRKSISSTDGNERNSRENVSSMQQNSRRSRISGSLEQKKNQKANHLNASKIEMTKLWKYASDVTRNRNVTSIAWNPRNSDILAASYGDYGIRITSSETNRVPEVQGGMICCWSLKNPTFPERIIQTDFGGLGITSVQFSTLHPSLLAAGFTDGSLALFDIRKRGNAPALRTSLGTGQHTGTIWEVCWTQKGKQENLITVGADGRIIEWSLKKGLERASGDLMILKRQQDQMGELLSPYAKGENQRATEALLSRNSGGMCFDFHQDGLFYLVGTEDGTLTKCARSQRDTHVTMYQRHEEPVYRVRWSPWWKDIFVSCSADWTARLYHQDRKCPVLTFHHPQEAVHDITWCPTHSTFIATATSSGRVYLWDISEPLEPISTYRISNDDRILTSIAFNSNNHSTYPILATADNHGEVTILQVRGQKLEIQINTEQGTQELIEALKPNMN